jgi:hypothetical protein
MERAGEAMQQIHGKLNIDKVDETMYVLLLGANDDEGWNLTYLSPGRNFENSMLWAKKLPKLLPAHLLASQLMRLS